MRQESALQRSHRNLPPPWDRIFSLGTRLVVWGLLFGVLYLLRSFFLLIFLTFVFAYIQAHGVDGLQHRLRNRSVRVVLVALVFLGFIGGVGYFLAPQLVEQVQEFAGDYQRHATSLNKTVHELGPKLHLPPKQVQQLKSFDIMDVVSELIGIGGAGDDDGKAGADPAPNPGEVSQQAQERRDNKAAVRRLMENLQSVFTPILGIGSAFLLALLFSFLIVLDLPKLTSAVTNLRNTKLAFIYEEVGDNIRDFGRVLGTALEAQLFIAIANTILTCIGLYFMGLPNLVFLATIVFFCSFIPVAGVFLSSTPICLVALQVPSGGIKLMLIAIALILVIHFIEAYFLNPKIFGHHFRMNAVLVLIVLTIGGKLFGVWGLVLGLPVVNYFFAHAIRYRKDEDPGGDAPPHQMAAS
jgi:predicted PurR-regulated permease PerM